MQPPAEPFDEDYTFDDVPGFDGQVTPPYWFPGQHLPDQARRMGLTHHVPDGALLDFAGNLDGAKLMHRVTAWVLLVIFGLPVVFAIMRLFWAFG